MQYDATSPGRGGGGGEYNVQEGFGWTNGVVFEFIKTFYQVKLNNSVSSKNSNDLNNNMYDQNNVE